MRGTSLVSSTRLTDQEWRRTAPPTPASHRQRETLLDPRFDGDSVDDVPLAAMPELVAPAEIAPSIAPAAPPSTPTKPTAARAGSLLERIKAKEAAKTAAPAKDRMRELSRRSSLSRLADVAESVYMYV